MLFFLPVNLVQFLFRAFLLFFLLLAPLLRGTAQEVTQLPEETLGFVVVSDLEQFDESLGRLLSPWGLRFAGVRPTLKAFCPGLALPNRPLLIGLAEDGRELAPFLLLPVDDFDGLAEAIHADRAGEELIVTLGSYDLEITPIAGGAFVQPLGRNLFNRPTGQLLSELKPMLGDSLATLNITDWGLERVAQQLRQERVHNRPSRPDLLRIRSLADLWSARSLLLAYGPLMERFSREAESLTIGLSAFGEGGDLELTCEVKVEDASQVEPKVAHDRQPVNLDQLAGERELIFSFQADRPLPATLVRLMMAWIESQPHEIDAERYAPREFNIYTEVVEELMASVTALRVVLVSPETDDPLTANQATLMQVSPGTPLADLVSEATLRWNKVIESSSAGTPLEVQVIPLADEGFRLATDVVAALGGPEIEGIVSLMERFYGPKGVRTVDYVPLGDGEQWLSTSLPAASREELLQRLSAADTSPNTQQETTVKNNGQLWIDRWFAWRQRIEDVGHAETKGRRVRPPMRKVAPLLFTISGENDRTRIEFCLTADAYEALAEYWLAEKVAVKDP